MGIATGRIHMRGNILSPTSTAQNKINSIDTLAFCCNNVMDTILGTGMVPVSEAEFNGQAAGKYVVPGSPDAEGNTAIPFQLSELGVRHCGYKVFRHPVIPVYLQVFPIHMSQSTSYSHFAVNYVVGKEITPSGFVGPTLTIENLQLSQTPSVQQSHTDGLQKNIYASCGPDHFWIASEGYLKMMLMTNASNRLYCGFYVNPVDPYGVGIFVQPGRDDFIVLAPSKIGLNTSYSEMSGEGFGNVLDGSRLSATKMYAFDGINYYDKKGYYPGFPEYSQPSHSAGARVYQGNALTEGGRSFYDYGLMPQSNIANGQLYDLDLWGTGPRKYIGITSWGTYADALNYYQVTLYNSIGLLLPWNDEG